MHPGPPEGKALEHFGDIQKEITGNCMNVNRKEKCSFTKPLRSAKPLLQNNLFHERLKFAEDFLSHKRFTMEAFNSMLKYIGLRFNVESGRAFQRKNETRALSLALYFDSWWPFIANSHHLTILRKASPRDFPSDESSSQNHSLFF